MEKKETIKKPKSEYRKRRELSAKINAQMGNNIYLFWTIDQLCLYFADSDKNKKS